MGKEFAYTRDGFGGRIRHVFGKTSMDIANRGARKVGPREFARKEMMMNERPLAHGPRLALAAAFVLYPLSLACSAINPEPTSALTAERDRKMTQQEDVQGIRETLLSYEAALNASDVDGVLALYAKDGVFMPTGAPTATGVEQVRASYTHVFNTIKLSIDFTIDEIEPRGDLAYATTRSEGQVRVLETDAVIPEANRELFILVRDSGDWKIARYMFNKANPQ